MQAQRLIPLVLFLALLVTVSRTFVNTTQAAAGELPRFELKAKRFVDRRRAT